MRKIIFGINLTADGCCDHRKGLPNEEVHDYFTQLIQEAGLLVYGRKTYELMVPFWPDMARAGTAPTKALQDFARAFDATPKLVFSRSLSSLEDRNSKLAKAGLQDEMLKLKQEEGGDILVGGVDLPSQLIKLNLVDEFHFVIHPVIAGEGRRLLDNTELQEQLQLMLAETKVFKSGTIGLRYTKDNR